MLVLLTSTASYYFAVSYMVGGLFPEELRELARAREASLPRFAEALKRFDDVHGCYPQSLSELVPDFVSEIPPELDPSHKWTLRESVIRYQVVGPEGQCNATFGWLRCRGPDCGSSYDVNAGEFWHAM